MSASVRGRSNLVNPTECRSSTDRRGNLPATPSSGYDPLRENLVQKCRHAIAAVALLLLAGACARPRSESYGFVAVLGDDTTSVERVMRTGNHIVSDAVGRSPIVTRRHWEADLRDDGTIARWSLDTYIPNAPMAGQHLHHTATFGGRSLEVSRRTSRGTTKFAYPKRYAETVPWNAFVYATYEPLLDAARRVAPDGKSARIGQYFFEGWDEGHIGYAVVDRQSDGSYLIGSTGLAGRGEAKIDSTGRMLSYSGQGTTYKQEVRRVANVPDVDSLTSRFAADERAKGVSSALSPRDTVRATVGGATLTIDYSRPVRRGRTLLGALIPYGEVWRTGANAATQLAASAPTVLAGVALPAGTYTLWTLPAERGVQLIINGESGQWGTEYNASRDIARRPMMVDSVAQSVDSFTIRIVPDSLRKRSGTGQLLLEWGTFRWSAPIRAGVH